MIYIIIIIIILLTGTCSSGLDPKDALQEIVTPLKAAQARARKQKAEWATQLTSSPYTNLLEEKKQAVDGNTRRVVSKKKVENGKKRDKTQKKDKVRSANCTSSDAKEEWPCLVCGEPYRNSRPVENWVQCFDCKHWSHEECLPGDAYYVCQNCESDDDL